MGAIAEPCHVRRLRCAMLSADRVERNQQAAPQHIPLEWHTDFGGEEMAEASERQVALPGRVGKPDGACLDEQIGRASCRERVWQSVSITVVAVSLKKKNHLLNKLS